MKKALAALTLCPLLALAAQGPAPVPPVERAESGDWPAAALLPDPPPAVHHHRITATYDADEERIHGTLALTWRNTTGEAVPNLCFHHYLNAFSSNRTTFFRESGGQLRGDTFEGDRWGWIEVESMRLGGGPDVSDSETFVSPDDGNPDDRTVALYDLPAAIPPGGEIDLEIEFTSQLPMIFARTGVHGNYVLAGQWYPKIGVFEDGAWNCHQFHAFSEFYADFGDYDVTLTLPAEYAGKIGATGEKVSEEVAGDEVTARFVQQGVHDFAWTADPDYLVSTETFDPQRDVPPEQRSRIAAELGLPESELALSPVTLTLFLQPAHAGQAERYFRSAREGIRGYGLRLGAYPYRTLTLVDPPKGASGSGGMEYPTFITLGTSPLLGLWPFQEVYAPEIVTIHEFGHQYFQGMSASNEFEESWLDEGVNSYFEMLVMEEEYGAMLDVLGFSLSPFDANRTSATYGPTDPIATPAWRFMSSTSYGLNSYPRTATMLRHLENLLGPGELARALRDFFREARFRHPTTSDFERVVEDSTGRDLGWFFDQALHSTRRLDYSIRKAESREVDDDEGFFWTDGERTRVGASEDEEDGEDEADEGSEGEDDGGDGEQWLSEVLVYREGEFVHPVTVEFRFEDGRTMRRDWEGDRRWRRYRFTTPVRLASAEVDPDGVMALDADRINNSRRVERRALPRTKLMTDFLFWMQTLFGAAGGVFS
jgi:hypothetical protein